MKKRKKRQSCDNRTVKAAVKISLKLNLPERFNTNLLLNEYADKLYKELYSLSGKHKSGCYRTDDIKPNKPIQESVVQTPPRAVKINDISKNL